MVCLWNLKLYGFGPWLSQNSSCAWVKIRFGPLSFQECTSLNRFQIPVARFPRLNELPLAKDLKMEKEVRALKLLWLPPLQAGWSQSSSKSVCSDAPGLQELFWQSATDAGKKVRATCFSMWKRSMRGRPELGSWLSA